MSVLSVAAVVLLQNSSNSGHDLDQLSIYLLIIAIVMVILLIGVMVGGIFALKLMNRVDGILTMVETRIGPMLEKTKTLMDELTPRVKSVSENTEQIVSMVRSKVEEIGVTVSELNETVREINGKTRAQVSRADGIVTDTLTATEEISHSVQNGIKAPIRKISGLVAGFRAGLETLIEKSPFGRT